MSLENRATSLATIASTNCRRDCTEVSTAMLSNRFGPLIVLHVSPALDGERTYRLSPRPFSCSLLELEPQGHRHLPRIRRRRVTAQAGVGLLQNARLP